MKNSEMVTIKVYAETRHRLKIIASNLGITMLDVVKRFTEADCSILEPLLTPDQLISMYQAKATRKELQATLLKDMKNPPGDSKKYSAPKPKQIEKE